MKEQKYELTGYCDNVSTIVSRRKRQKCEENTAKSKVKADVYNFVTHHHDGPPQIVVGNPISKNPCSYDAVKDVLLQIKNDVGDELLYPFVKEWIISKDTTPSATDYFQWCSNVTDANYKFILEVIFTYALALYVFRAGIRRNNAEAIFAARLKFSPLFFGMNKTNYQKIAILDLLMRESAPKEIQDFLSKHETFSRLQQQRLWKDVKNEKKALLLKFYKDLLSIREHIQSRQVDEDDSEENEEDFVPNDDIPTSSASGI
uniref:Uncharacterized protein n=1 Tax=Magallana gigas TaxID=29159 RepID=K1QDZ0_MAGGI